MNCSSCGAQMRIGAGHTRWQCDYCGSVYVPNPGTDNIAMLGGDTGLDCPVCRTRLEYASIAGAPVKACPGCRGFLVELGTFVWIVQELRSHRTGPGVPRQPLDEAALERRLRCPWCRAEMDTHPYGGPGAIVIDNCPRCELNWLDAGELQRVVHGEDVRYSELPQVVDSTVLYRY